MDTIGRFVDALVREHRERPALISATRQVTYAELGTESNRMAEALARLGVAKGTHVGILLPNRPEWLECAFGALKLGAIIVPLNTLFRAPELEYALRHADVAVLLAVPQFLNHSYAEMLRQISPRLPCLREVVMLGEHGLQRGPVTKAEVTVDEAAAIFFTSGTTAAPKGVVHTHASMLQAAENIADRLGLTADDRTWGYLPFFFAGGLVAVALATLSRGGAVLLQEVFEPAATLRLMVEHGCTTLFAWPHQAEALLAHPDFDRTQLRIRKGVGANTPWAARLYPPDHLAIGTWGMTETGPMAAASRYDDPLPIRAGTHGRPMPGLEFRIIDSESQQLLAAGEEGELLVRGSSVMAHYYGMSPLECFDADGFFHTGDLASLDADGYLHFRGRIKDVIKTAGVNVAAAEIESVLQQDPEVTVAYVTAAPHATRGESVVAFVVPREAGCTEAQLIAFCRERLASYKVPRHIFFCAEADLPVLGSGKVDKRALRAMAAARVHGQSG